MAAWDVANYATPMPPRLPRHWPGDRLREATHATDERPERGAEPQTQAPGWMPVMPTLGLRYMC